MLTQILSFAFPLVLLSGSLWRLRRALRASHRLDEYAWAGAYSLVFCFSSFWMATSLSVSLDASPTPEHARATLAGGPYLFATLSLVLVLRPLLQGLIEGGQALFQGLRTQVAKVRKAVFQKSR